MDGSKRDPLSADPVFATAVLAKWSGLEGAKLVLVNHSENHTYRLERSDGAVSMLRLHRPGYQTRTAIASELAWMAALSETTEIVLARPLPGIDGETLQEVAPDRFAVLFEFEPGTEPSMEVDLVPLFNTLGRYAATAHAHVIGWTPPDPFERPRLDLAGLLDPDSPWGDWRHAPNVEGELLDDLNALDAALRVAVQSYGEGENRFGLIHADMRLANLLVDGDRTVLLDFDDCGYGWFLYDLAAALSFHETDARVPGLIRAWFAGYLEVRQLTAEDVAMVDTMILLRRMSLLAWIGSHKETDLARRHAPTFAADTAALARRYLKRS